LSGGPPNEAENEQVGFPEANVPILVQTPGSRISALNTIENNEAKYDRKPE